MLHSVVKANGIIFPKIKLFEVNHCVIFFKLTLENVLANVFLRTACNLY